MFSNKVVCILIGLFMSCSVSYAQEKNAENKAPSLKEIETKEDFNRLEELLEEYKQSAERLVQIKRYECLKAFGDKNFCDCLVSNLAMGLTFKDYIRIITSSKEEIGYQQLSEEDKKMADTVYSSREKCVQKRGK